MSSNKKSIFCHAQMCHCLFAPLLFLFLLPQLPDTWLESILYRWSCTRVNYGRYKKRLRESDRAKIDERPSVGSLNRQTLRDEMQADAHCHRSVHLKVHSCIMDDVMRVIINSERLNEPFFTSLKKNAYITHVIFNLTYKRASIASLI